MNLQELLDYRTTCLIHNEPMHLWNEPKKKKNNEVIRTPEGIIGRRKGDVSEGDIFRLDGTCKVDYSYALRRIDFPWTVGVMCDKCHRVPVHTFMENPNPSINNIKHQAHFYTFSLLPNVVSEIPEEANYANCTYVCTPGIEVIKYFDGDKFYHLNGHVGGGAASFNMGRLDSEDILDQLMSSIAFLKVPQFNPAVIKDINRMVEKMKIYNLFS